jgi:hypothetical protein
MKNELLASVLLALTTGLSFAQDQAQNQGQLSTTVTTTTTTVTGGVQTTLPKPRLPAAAPIVPIEGVVQAAIRHGHPFQMINPAAPARYGDGQDRVMHDPKDPGKPKGISFFAWRF